jgi:pimeloyl-ACP methyl ester carboxylesterase
LPGLAFFEEYDVVYKRQELARDSIQIPFRRRARRSRLRTNRPVGREPRRLLRAAGGSFREAREGLRRAVGTFDFGAVWDRLPELTRETFRVRSHCADEAGARRNAATLSLEGVAGSIGCPLCIVAGRQDRLVPWQDAERLAREAAGTVELMLIEDGNHVANNRAYRWRLQTADWMAEQLGSA